MKEPDDALAKDFLDICHKSGLKATSLRLAVYRYLKTSGEHPDVDQVWNAVRRELPTISRESVYRVLNDFASHGVIAILDRADVVARYDVEPKKRHDHFQCERCGRFFDFEVKALPELVDAVAGALGRIEHAEIRVRGICNDCLRQEEDRNRKSNVAESSLETKNGDSQDAQAS